MVISTGPMAVNTKEDGKMESNMVLELTRPLAVRRSRASGQMARDFTGCPTHKDSSD